MQKGKYLFESGIIREQFLPLFKEKFEKFLQYKERAVQRVELVIFMAQFLQGATLNLYSSPKKQRFTLFYQK